MTTSLRVFLVAAVFAMGAACWSGFTSSAQEKAKEEKGKAGPDAQKWEYKFYQLTTDQTTDEGQMNRLGDEGWELVAVMTAGNARALSYHAIFKKMKR
jgi:hypothetical protein